MVGLAGGLKHASSGGSSVGTSSHFLVVAAVGAVVATCPDFSIKRNLEGLHEISKVGNLLPVSQAVNALNLKCTMLDVAVVNCSG